MARWDGRVGVITGVIVTIVVLLFAGWKKGHVGDPVVDWEMAPSRWSLHRLASVPTFSPLDAPTALPNVTLCAPLLRSAAATFVSTVVVVNTSCEATTEVSSQGGLTVAGGELRLVEVTPASAPVSISGSFALINDSLFTFSVSGSYAWSQQYEYQILLVNATQCNGTYPISILNCPSGYGCGYLYDLTSYSCRISLSVFTNRVVAGTYYYTVQMIKDCTLFSVPIMKQVMQATGTTFPISSMVVVSSTCDPTRSSFYATFQCQSYAASVADRVCSVLWDALTSPGSQVRVALGVYATVRTTTFYGYSSFATSAKSENSGLWGLLALLAVVPLGLGLCWWLCCCRKPNPPVVTTPATADPKVTVDV